MPASLVTATASIALVVAGATASMPTRAAAQSMVDRMPVDTASSEGEGSASAKGSVSSEGSAGSSRIRGIVGRRPDRRRLIGGMWALHPYEPQFPELDWTRGVGVQLSHWFAATFVNSYEERAFVGGLERNWMEHAGSVVDVGIGYRVGIVTGYDERLFQLARHAPLLPFVGLLVWGEAGPVGIDLFYVYRAITFEGSVRF